MTNGDACEREAAVAAAARDNRWSDELREHVAGCGACAEAVFVTLHLATVAAEVAARPLPDPRLLWLRARLESRRRAVRRATAPVGAMQWLGGLTGAVGAAVLLGRLWPGLRAAAARLADLSTPAVGATDFPAAVIGASLVVLVVLALTERSPLRQTWR